jgi:hypothetical protein
MANRDGSKGHKIIDQRSWCRGNCFIDASTGPPLEKLWTDSYGGDEAAVISINYPNSKDRQMGWYCTISTLATDPGQDDGQVLRMHPHVLGAMELCDIVGGYPGENAA